MQRLRTSLVLKMVLLAALIVPLIGIAAASAFVQADPGQPIVTLGGAIGAMPLDSPDRSFTYNVADGGAGVGQVSVTLWHNSAVVPSHSIADAPLAGILDFSNLGPGWFKIDVEAQDGGGNLGGPVSRDVRIFIPLSTMAGNRAQDGAFNVPIQNLPAVGPVITQGAMGRNPDGPVEPYLNSIAYRYFSNPNYNPGTGLSSHTAPYAMSSVTHSEDGPLAEVPQNGLRYSFIGQTLGSDETQDLRAEGPISLSDYRLHEGADVIYFQAIRGGALLHNMERRVYFGGQWQIIEAGTGGNPDVVIGSGTIIHTYLFLDYTSLLSGGYSLLNADLDDKPFNAALAASGSTLLILNFDSLQSPVFSDNASEPQVSRRYAVYNMGATLGLLAELTAPEPLPNLSISDVTVNEGDSGTTNATFTVTLSAASGQVVTVNFTTQDGAPTPAIAGSDYAANSGTLTFAPGETSKQVTVLVNGDTAVEPNETFRVELSNAANANITDAVGVGTVTNDDAAPALSLAINDVSVPEGDSGTTNAVFTVTLSAASADIVSVVYTTYALTATAGTDYDFISATLSFSPGETIKQVTVVVNGDTDVEGTETFRVLLTSPGNATISDAEGIGTITEEAGEGAPAGESAPPFDGTYPLPDGYCICTPVVMNTDITATETWFARASATEMDVDIIAHAVNAIDPERVDVTITTSAGSSNYSVSYTSGEVAAAGAGFEKTVRANLTGLTVGEIIRLEITTPAPTPATQPHYRLKFWGADLAGINSPSFPSLEEVKMRWLVQANAGEQINLDFFTAGSVVLPNPATSVTYRLFKPSGVLHSSGTVVVAAGDEITVPAIAGADAGMWMIEFMSNGHVRMAKTSNIDMGLYVSWNSGGFATKTVRINKDGAQATGTAYTVKILQPVLTNTGTNYVEIDSKVTSTGTAVFEKLLPGNYRVEVVSPAGVSTPNPQDDVLPCDSELLNTFETNTIVVVAPSSVSDKAWVDINANGTQDSGEPGLASVTVRLLNASDAVLATTVTDANGLYTFDNVSAGTYKVGFTPPSGWGFIAKDVGGNDGIDSDANPGTGRTDAFALAAGVNDSTRDAGFRKADVSVTKIAEPSAPSSGQQVLYRVTVTNNGPTTATNVVVTDTLPANAAVLTLSPGAPTCAASGRTITCTYAQIGVGDSRIIEVNTNPWPTNASSMNNTVSVTANEPDPNMDNNSAGLTTQLPQPVAVPGVSFWGLALLTIVFGGLLYFRGRAQLPRTR